MIPLEELTQLVDEAEIVIDRKVSIEAVTNYTPERLASEKSKVIVEGVRALAHEIKDKLTVTEERNELLGVHDLHAEGYLFSKKDMLRLLELVKQFNDAQIGQDAETTQ